MTVPEIHRKSLVIDGHCDSVLNYDRESEYDFNRENQGVHLDYEKMKTGSIDLQFMALFIEDQYLPQGGFSHCVRLLETFRENIANNPNFSLVANKKQLESINPLQNDKKYGLLTVEGGEVLEGRLSLLRALFNLGVRGLTLTWNRRNQLADGCDLKERAGGLTDFGIQVINDMDRLGMIIDVSHLSRSSFYHVLEQTENPIVATHSNAAIITEHPRNLNDDQLKAIAETGGVIGLNFAPHFLNSKDGSAGLQDMFAHVNHILKVVGDKHIALGSDFDGVGNLPKGIETAEDLPKLTEFLQKQGISDSSLENILGMNWLRVLQQVLPD